MPVGGEAALKELSLGSFDVVVSDMRMPHMDGAQLLGEVKERYPQVVRIVLSGHSELETILRSVGPTHQYLAKPCDPDKLKAVITRACALRDLLGDNTLRELASQMSSIPSLPKTYTEIVEELQSPEASIQRIGQIVSKDVGMAAKILQLVNSAFFGLRHNVSDPAQAASFLGVDTIKALVLSVHVFSQLKFADVDGLCLETLWNHSALAGALAKRISAEEGGSEQLRGDALTAGLLHDSGKLILAANLPDRYSEVLKVVRDDGVPLWEAERKHLGATHAELGAYLLGLWGLPDPIVEAVAFHHAPSRCPVEGLTPLLAVHVANALLRTPNRSADPSDIPCLDVEYRPAARLAGSHPGLAGPLFRGGGRSSRKMSERILCVDDDANVLQGIRRQFRKTFSIETAGSGAEGLELIASNGPYAVVASDMRMPGMDGIQFLRAVREQSPDTTRIMLTGNADQQTAINAVNEGPDLPVPDQAVSAGNAGRRALRPV